MPGFEATNLIHPKPAHDIFQRLPLVVCVVLLVFLAARASATPLFIMPLGDSITWGYPFNSFGGYRTKLWLDFGGDNTKQRYLGSLQEGPTNLGDKHHEGHSGFTIAAAPVGFGNITDHIATYLAPTVNPDIILLMLGTNDINDNYQVDGAPARLDHLISLISDRATGLKPNAELIVSSIMPIDDAHNQYRSSPTDFSANDRVNAFNAALPAIIAAHRAAGEHVYFTDINRLFTFADIYDGLHPTRAAYDKLGDAWYQAIQSVPEPSTFLSALIAAAICLTLRTKRTTRRGERASERGL
jgi:lysophospholipase L1-like esterase